MLLRSVFAGQIVLCCEILHPQSNVWREQTRLPGPIFNGAAATNGHHVFLAGGTSGGVAADLPKRRVLAVQRRRRSTKEPLRRESPARSNSSYPLSLRRTGTQGMMPLQGRRYTFPQLLDLHAVLCSACQIGPA